MDGVDYGPATAPQVNPAARIGETGPGPARPPALPIAIDDPKKTCHGNAPTPVRIGVTQEGEGTEPRAPSSLSRRVALRINDIEVALVVLMVFVAAMMARGLWLLP